MLLRPRMVGRAAELSELESELRGQEPGTRVPFLSSPSPGWVRRGWPRSFCLATAGRAARPRLAVAHAHLVRGVRAPSPPAGIGPPAAWRCLERSASKANSPATLSVGPELVGAHREPGMPADPLGSSVIVSTRIGLPLRRTRSSANECSPPFAKVRLSLLSGISAADLFAVVRPSTP